MKPFVLLATRVDDVVADEEYAAMARLGGLNEGELLRIRLEREPMPELNLDEYSGVILGGSPFNFADDTADKSETQLRVERELDALLDRIVSADFPFLGACYGVGALGLHQGGNVDGTFSEPAGVVTISVTEAGRADPLLAGMPDSFDAFVGHKEALSVAPPHATVLASSATCPIQLFKVGQNVYATQFHPELDVSGFVLRVQTYRHEGYFHPDELDALIAEVSPADVRWASAVLRNFVNTYAKSE